MKLSRTAGYAVHALVHIAQHDNGSPVIGHEAAEELGISKGFLLRILVMLSRAGLLRSMKGPNGGYNLGRAPKDITLLDVVEAADGPVEARVDPVSSPPNALDKALHACSADAVGAYRKELERVTLADLVGGRKRAHRGAAVE